MGGDVVMRASQAPALPGVTPVQPNPAPQRVKRRLFVHPDAVIPPHVAELYEVVRNGALAPGEWYLGVPLKPPSARFAEEMAYKRGELRGES